MRLISVVHVDPFDSHASLPQGDLSFSEVKDRYLPGIRPLILPASFALGTLTIGLKTGLDNFPGDVSHSSMPTEKYYMHFSFSQPLSIVSSAVVSGLIIAACAWVVFDFSDSGDEVR